MGAKRKSRSADLQIELVGVRRPATGRVERALYVAVPRAIRDGHLDKELDAGIVAVARSVARALDLAAVEGDKWAVARLSQELRELLTRMRLEPTSRGSSSDGLADIIAAIGAPE